MVIGAGVVIVAVGAVGLIYVLSHPSATDDIKKSAYETIDYFENGIVEAKKYTDNLVGRAINHQEVDSNPVKDYIYNYKKF